MTFIGAGAVMVESAERQERMEDWDWQTIMSSSNRPYEGHTAISVLEHDEAAALVDDCYASKTQTGRKTRIAKKPLRLRATTDR